VAPSVILGPVQRSEAQTLATAALERFRHLHLYADRKLIAEGRLGEAAHRLHRRTRSALLAMSLTGGWLAWDSLSLMRGVDGRLHLLDGMVGSLMILSAAAVVIGTAWQHGRTRELVNHVESLLPEDATEAVLVGGS